MGNLDDITRLPEDFDGKVRLFPLPSLVLFPHAMQPLHIFESRYCEMLNDAMQSDELIAMATLTKPEPGWKGDPPVDQTICVGKVVSHVEREDERHNILLVGIKRARIISEVDTARCYRIAQIDVLDDVYPSEGVGGRGQLRADLLQSFGKVIPATKSVQQGLSELLAGTMGLGPITDIIAHTLPLNVSMKLELLDQANVDLRAARLIEFLDGGAVKLEPATSDETDPEASGSGIRLAFPPPFSLN